MVEKTCICVTCIYVRVFLADFRCQTNNKEKESERAYDRFNLRDVKYTYEYDHFYFSFNLTYSSNRVMCI